MIKGIPLSLQTPGSLTARGRGDCDLFVDPTQVGAAIALLESAGFALSCGSSCVGDDSMRGRYSRFVSIEISLHRDVGERRQWIDLHWHATHVRGVLPGFQALWQRGEEMQINRQPVRTLSRRDALVHACCNAATDCWMALRNLVDIERLSREVPTSQLVELQSLRPVRKSWLVLADSMGDPASAWSFGKVQSLKLKAQTAQQQPWRSLGDGAWTVANRLKYFSHTVNLSRHPVHGISVLLHQVMPPADLIDPQTGANRSLLVVLLRRAEKLWRRLQAQSQSPR